MKFLSALFIFALTVSCTSKVISPAPHIKLISESDYYDTVKKNSRHQQIYSGLYNSIDMTAAVINTEVFEAQVDQMARVFIRDENK